MNTVIPFQGFYDSWFSQDFYNAIEDRADWMTSDGRELYNTPDHVTKEQVAEIISDHAGFSTYMDHVAREYVDAYGDWLNEQLGDRLVALTFDELTSPKEYNFTTDRIFCKIARSDVVRIYQHVGRKALRKKAREMFTSRSGFISFYNPDIDTWGTTRTWDHNQVLCLLECLDTEDMNYEIYNKMSEALYQCFDDCVDWKAVDEKINTGVPA